MSLTTTGNIRKDLAERFGKKPLREPLDSSMNLFFSRRDPALGIPVVDHVYTIFARIGTVDVYFFGLFFVACRDCWFFCCSFNAVSRRAWNELFFFGFLAFSSSFSLIFSWLMI